MKIALLSRGRTLYSTRRIADAARRRRHEVRVIDPYRCSFGILYDELAIYYEGRLLQGFDCIIPRIGASSLAHSVGMLRQFELSGVPCLNSSESICTSKDKFHAHQALAAGGVRVPHTLTTRDPNQIPALIKELGGPPIIIKVLKGTQGLGVVVADTVASAMSMIQAMWSLNQEIAVQEYIAEANGSDVRVFIVGGEIIGAMRRQAPVNDFRSNLHRGGTSSTVNLTDELRTSALRAAEILDLDIAGIDILESSRGPLVLEANASPGLQGIEATTNVDVAKAIIRFAEVRGREFSESQKHAAPSPDHRKV